MCRRLSISSRSIEILFVLGTPIIMLLMSIGSGLKAAKEKLQ